MKRIIIVLVMGALALGGSNNAAKADLYRVESGSLSMTLGVGTSPIVLPLYQGTIVEGTVTGGILQSLSFPNFIIATQGAQFKIRDAVGIPSSSGYQAAEYATVTLHNETGGPGFRSGATAKTKIMGYVVKSTLQSPNGYPTLQHFGTPFSGLTYPYGNMGPGRTAGYAYRVGNQGGFIQNGAGFGGPLGLVGQVQLSGQTVELDVIGKDITLAGGGWTFGQALSWATGIAQARTGKGDANMNFGPDKAYVSPNFVGYAYQGLFYGSPFDGSTGGGPQGKLVGSGAAAVLGTAGSTQPGQVIKVDESGNPTEVMTVLHENETISITLVQPALYDPGESLAVMSTLNLELRAVSVPEPGTGLLFGLGLMGLAASRRKR